MLILYYILYFGDAVLYIFAEKGNEAFHKFLKLLGDRIDLKGWDKFKAGLDVKCKLAWYFALYYYLDHNYCMLN